jgi:hypothetical protein
VLPGSRYAKAVMIALVVMIIIGLVLSAIAYPSTV